MAAHPVWVTLEAENKAVQMPCSGFDVRTLITAWPSQMIGCQW
jgi:hypothetical protein